MRPLMLAGTVVRGDGRGHGLGFPTANVRVSRVTCRDGVYAAWVRIATESTWREATVSIGDNPTFGDVTETRVECHIHDFTGDLYGAHASVLLVRRIRDMQSFTDVTSLVERTAVDLNISRRYLAATAPPAEHPSPASRPDAG